MSDQHMQNTAMKEVTSTDEGVAAQATMPHRTQLLDGSSQYADSARRRTEAVDAIAKAAGQALERAFPWGYRSTDSEP